jgi:hypothetical protein
MHPLRRTPFQQQASRTSSESFQQRASIHSPLLYTPYRTRLRLARPRSRGEYKANSAILPFVVRTCKVSVADIAGVEHSTEVTAGSLYEAVAAGLTSLRKDDWVGEIGVGLTTVRVEVQQPPVTHEVRMKDFQAWLERKSGSPAEMVLRDKLLKMLAGSRGGPP